MVARQCPPGAYMRNHSRDELDTTQESGFFIGHHIHYRCPRRISVTSTEVMEQSSEVSRRTSAAARLALGDMKISSTYHNIMGSTILGHSETSATEVELRAQFNFSSVGEGSWTLRSAAVSTRFLRRMGMRHTSYALAIMAPSMNWVLLACGR